MHILSLVIFYTSFGTESQSLTYLHLHLLTLIWYGPYLNGHVQQPKIGLNEIKEKRKDEKGIINKINFLQKDI